MTPFLIAFRIGAYELSEARVVIRVDTRYQEAFGAARLDDLLLDVAETTLLREKAAGPDRVTVIITDDEALRKLNREFMGYDEPTDVLSFNAAPGTGALPETAPDVPDSADNVSPWPDVANEESDALGDIAISFERAVAQAEEAGHDLAHELSVLTAHGVLHLLGYDHAEPDEKRVMFGKTDEILAVVADRPKGETGDRASG